MGAQLGVSSPDEKDTGLDLVDAVKLLRYQVLDVF